MALSLALLVVGALFVRGALRAADATPGFALDRGLIAEVDPSLVAYSPERSAAAHRGLLAHLRTMPAVEAVSLASRSCDIITAEVGSRVDPTANCHRAPDVQVIEPRQPEPTLPMSPSSAAKERYELLLKMSQQTSRTFDLPEILQHLLDSVRLVVPFDAAGVFVLNAFVSISGRRADRMIAAMASIGFDPNPNREDPMLLSGRGIIGRVIRTGMPVVAPDVRVNADYVAGRASTLSEVAIPITIDGRVIGALNLESDRLGAYTDADARELSFFATAAAISIDRAVLHHQVLEKQHLDHHMALAREVQASLLPRSAPRVPGYDLDGINLPTMEIGGDYYDYLPLGDGRLGLVVADVAGKGVAAALIMATFRAALRIELRRDHAVGEVMDDIDRLLLDSIDPSRYVTAVYGILEPETGEFTYVNCGHNPPMMLHARGGCTLLDTARPALGMAVPAMRETGRVRFEPGDMLAIYTDGVVELSAPVGQEFGADRLESLLRRAAVLPAKEVVQTVIRETLEYSGRLSYEDDFTLLIVKREG